MYDIFDIFWDLENVTSGNFKVSSGKKIDLVDLESLARQILPGTLDFVM